MPGKTGKRRTWISRSEKKRQRSKRDSQNRREIPEESGRRRQRSSDYDSPVYETAGILQKYLEPDKDREREIEEKKKEIMAAKQAKEERRRKEMKELAATRVSYVRKPFARRSRMSVLLAAAALALGGWGLFKAVKTQGQAPLVCGAMGLCSILLSIVAVWYGGISFLEDDKNYVLAKLGIALGVLMLAGWAVIIKIGLGG